jgi:thioredoxin reductase (NADPH)
MKMAGDTPAADNLNGGVVRNGAFPRHDQTFPALTAGEIARMRRFGEIKTYKQGDRLFEAGKPGPGMFVVLSGHVAITQRDGLGHVTPVIEQGPGQFLAEISQLSVMPRTMSKRC